MKEFKVWKLYTSSALQTVLLKPFIVFLFFFSKLLRLGLFLVFLNFIFSQAVQIGDYSRHQIIFFFLSFNLIDTLAQLFFRDVYRFRPLVVSGGLDYLLVKPIHPLIKVLLGGMDVIDLFFFALVLLATVGYGLTFITQNFAHWLLYTLLVINGLLLASAFHIAVLGLGVITTTVDHLVMIYRDLSGMLRIPVDLYIEPIRFLLTFIIPLGIMITFPAQVLMNLLSPASVMIAVLIGILAFYLAMKFWNYSLRHYQSASS